MELKKGFGSSHAFYFLYHVTRKEEKVLGNSMAFLLGDFFNIKYSMSNKNVDTNIHESYCASLKIHMKKAAQDGKWLNLSLHKMDILIANCLIFWLYFFFFFVMIRLGYFSIVCVSCLPLTNNLLLALEKSTFIQRRYWFYNYLQQ